MANLATATFTGESASGWQQVNLPTPVAITSNTTYIASYFAPQGHYAIDAGYFATAGVTNYPLWALANGVDGDNGVFIQSASSAFPNQTFNSANYWVDLVFVESLDPDTNAPTVVRVRPANGAVGGERWDGGDGDLQ